MEDVYTVGLRLVQALLHYRTDQPPLFVVSFPSAQTPFETPTGHPLNSEPEAEPSACPVHSTRLLPACMPQYEKPLAIFCDLETWECLLCNSCWLLPPTYRLPSCVEEQKVYDLCSRTAVNLFLQPIYSICLWKRRSLYSSSRDFMLHIREGISYHFHRLEYPYLSTTFVYKWS